MTNQFNTTKRSPVWPDRVRKLDLGLLGVSKKVTAEAAERFYGRNMFSFNALFERHLKWIEQWQVIFPSRIDWLAITCQGHGIANLEVAVVDAGSRRSVKMPATYKPLVSLAAPSDLCLQCPQTNSLLSLHIDYLLLTSICQSEECTLAGLRLIHDFVPNLRRLTMTYLSPIPLYGAHRWPPERCESLLDLVRRMMSNEFKDVEDVRLVETQDI